MTSAVEELRATRPDVRILSSSKPVHFEGTWYEVMDAQHFWMEWRNRIFLARLPATGLSADSELRGLEVGCGYAVARRLIEDVTRWRIDATDVNPSALRASLTGRGETLLYDIFDLREELVGAYDVLFLLDVIEHIEQPMPFLAAALRHLKPGGVLFANVPALQRWYSVFDEVHGHHRRYDAQGLLEELRGLPVEPIEVRYWGLGMLPLLVARSWRLRGRDAGEGMGITREGLLPPNRLANALLGTLMRLETRWLKRVPLGTSLFLTARRL